MAHLATRRAQTAGPRRPTPTAGRLAVLAALAAILAGFLAAGPARAASGALATTPVVRELITVRARSHSTTYATLRAFRISGDKRVRVFGPWIARVGYNGVARLGQKREGDGRTPAGTYGFSFFFGVTSNLGFAFPFRHAYRFDFWDDDPASTRYNEWVNARRHYPGANPEPLHQVPAYNYAAVIAYNTARVPGLGSAIFLHVGTGGPTAGCVSLPQRRLIKILRWLRPAEDPQITISG